MAIGGTNAFEILKDWSLVRPEARIGATWIQRSSDGKNFVVTNPATQGAVAKLPDCGQPEFDLAIAAAVDVQRSWAEETARQRADLLKAWHRLWLENMDDLALILTCEQGKPLAEAKSEIAYGASYLEWFAGEARRTYGDVIPSHAPGLQCTVIKQPVGVVAAITPWNFPNAMIARKVAPALAAGCAVVSKPAAETPLSTLALAVLAERAGIPAGLFSVVPTTRSAEFGEFVTKDARIAKITFTGSTAVGRTLMRQASGQIKKLSLELGGNAPFIVFDDADIDAAVSGLLHAKFRNAGQTCVCANRIYVQNGIYDQFIERFSSCVSKLEVGDGRSPGSQIGPLISEASVAKVSDHIEDALSKGGKLITGGMANPAGPLFYTPTVISEATHDMKVASDETFGPLAPIFRFATDDEVVAMANSTEYGLAAYFFTKSLHRVSVIAEALEVGIVGVNTGTVSTEVAPFGGIKQSGLGREGSKYGIDDYLDLKSVIAFAG